MDHKISTTAEAIEASALPRRRDADANGARDEQLPDALQRAPLESKSAAEWAYERLILYIQNFEKQLDSDHEVAMGFAGGEAGTLRIQGLGFFEPDIVTFYGSNPAGLRTQLIQHVTQLNVVLTAAPKPSAQEKPNRIGFELLQNLDKDPGQENT